MKKGKLAKSIKLKNKMHKIHPDKLIASSKGRYALAIGKYDDYDLDDEACVIVIADFKRKSVKHILDFELFSEECLANSWDCGGLSITPNEKIAVFSHADELAVWDLNHSIKIRSISNIGTESLIPISALDDKRLLVIVDSKYVTILDLTNGKPIKTFGGHSGAVRSAALTTDESQLVTITTSSTWMDADDGSLYEILKIWNQRDADQTQEEADHLSQVRKLAITPNGKYAISTSEDYELKVWNLEDGSLNRTLLYSSDQSAYYLSQSLSASDNVILHSMDSVIHQWDLNTGKIIHTFKDPDNVEVYNSYVTPDGLCAITVSHYGRVSTWNLKEGKLISSVTLPDGPKSEDVDHMEEWGVLADFNGKHAVSSSRQGRLLVWDLKTGKVSKEIPGDGDWLVAISMTADCRFCLTISMTGKIRLLDLQSGNSKKEFNIDVVDEELLGIILSISDDASIAVTTDSWDLKAYKLDSEDTLELLSSADSQITALQLTPCGMRLMTTSEDGNLRIWDLKSGNIVADFTAEYPLRNACLTGNGKTIVAGDAIGRVHILRFES